MMSPTLKETSLDRERERESELLKTIGREKKVDLKVKGKNDLRPLDLPGGVFISIYRL